MLKNNIDDEQKEKLFKENQLELLKDDLNTLVKINSNDNVFDVANSLYESGLVEFCHPNFFGGIEFHDTYYQYQYNLKTPPDTSTTPVTPGGVNASLAWSITTGSSDIVVAVIDEGVESMLYEMPSNKLVVLNGSNFSGSASADPDDPSPTTTEYHGQACAGLIIAQHNDYGIKGIAPGCKVMPVKIDGLSTTQNVADAFTFAYNNGAEVISFSVGYDSIIEVIVYAIQNCITYGRNNKGMIVCCAAGNKSNRDDNDVSYFPDFPASISNSYDIISVGATDSTDVAANYTPSQNYKITLAATSSKYIYKPTEHNNVGTIWSLDKSGSGGCNPWLGGQYYPNDNNYDDYQAYTSRFGGTSAAAPLVAGTAALILSIDPDLTNEEVIELICTTVDKVGNYTYQSHPAFIYGTKCWELGYGRLNTYEAVFAAWCAAKKASGPVDVEQEKPLINSITINPNPANPATTLHYTLAKPGNVKLAVYNSNGQKVATLVDNYMSAGKHSAVFDGSDLASGVYFYRLESTGFAKSGKMLLIK